MEPITTDEVRRCFINLSRSERASVTLPSDLASTDWDALDFLGWRDPRAPLRAYLVTPAQDGLVGIGLSRASTDRQRRGTAVCDLCLTAHPSDDVALYVARRVGAAGRRGNTVGMYFCADLACSLYARGLRRAQLLQGPSLPLDKRLTRLNGQLDAFVRRVQATGSAAQAPHPPPTQRRQAM